MKILLTDDLFTNRLHAGIAIRALGYSFDEAGNGDEAIEKMRVNDYDIVLMDIEMPVRNGLETTRFVRENFTGKKRDTPIIAITAHDPADYFEDFAKEGFSGLITKPITKIKLENSISFLKKNEMIL